MRMSPMLAAILLVGCASQPPAGAVTPTADASPTVPPPSAPVSAAPFPYEDVQDTRLAAGTYTLRFSSIGGVQAYPTLAMTFTVGAGWNKVLIDGLVWNDAGYRLGFSIVDNLYVDPCVPDQGLVTPPVGPSVTDLASAMSTVPGWELIEADHDLYMGFPGIRLVLSVPDDMSSCPFEESRLAHTIGFPGFLTSIPGGEIELWILSVEGTRLVVSASRGPGLSAAASGDLQATLDSIVIRP